MISTKTSEEIAIMQKGGKILGGILSELMEKATVDTSLFALEEIAQERIKKAGATPSFSTVRGYKWATCLCVNEEVVHAPPRPYMLKEGDVLTIDIGMVYEGFHTDTAWTKIIQNSKFLPHRQAGRIQNDEEKERFLQVGKVALEKAIKAARPGNRVGHISEAIEQTITSACYNVVTALTGHGIGTSLHEEPLIPECVDDPIEKTPLLFSGMTVAIEVIYAKGNGSIIYSNEDGWTLATKDRSLTAVFEHTIAICQKETVVLTKV